VRGFTVVYQETYVKTAKLQVLGLMECLVKRTILLIMYILIYHWERIHSGTSENLRQKWPRFANFVFWWDVKTIYWLCIYHCERIHSGISKNLRQKWQRFGSCGLIRCLEKELYYWLWVYHGERIHSGIFIKQIQCPMLILTCTYHCERIHSSIPSNLRQTIKPTSDLAEDCQVWCGGDEK